MQKVTEKLTYHVQEHQNIIVPDNCNDKSNI